MGMREVIHNASKSKTHKTRFKDGENIGDECPICSLQLIAERRGKKTVVICACGFELPLKGRQWRNRVEWLARYMYNARSGRRRTYDPASEDDIFRWDSWR